MLTDVRLSWGRDGRGQPRPEFCNFVAFLSSGLVELIVFHLFIVGVIPTTHLISFSICFTKHIAINNSVIYNSVYTPM